jgi:hypothetical protein
MTKIINIYGGSSVKDWVLGEDGWSCNGLHVYLPPAATPTAWFQIHREEDLYKESPEHLQWLSQKHDFPIWMHQHFAQYPASRTFPFGLMRSLWPFETMPSFSCSFSWMVATALLEGYTRIVCHGVNLSSHREAWLEAPNFMAWLGIAAGRGIEVELDGRLAEPYLYGLESRGVPTWLPGEVASELMLDFWDQGRDWRRAWEREVRAGNDRVVRFEDR